MNDTMQLPVLEMIRIPMFRVHHTAIEQFVKQIYKTSEVNFLTAAGVTPGMVPEYFVNGKLPEGAATMRRVAHIKSGRPVSKHAHLLLNLLGKDGWIPKGTYIVDTKELPDPTEVYKELLRTTRNPQGDLCLKFKDKHKSNAEFVRRSGLCDQAWIDRFSA